jgi:hypothetical protein
MADVVDDQEKEDISSFLIAMAVLIFGAVFFLIGLELRVIWRAFEKRNALVLEMEKEASMFDPELQPHMLLHTELALGKVLGQGAQGVVRKAVYQKEGVAVKIMSMCLGDDEMTTEISVDTLHEVETEAKCLQRLRHPNITSYFGVSFLKVSTPVKPMRMLPLHQHCLSSTHRLGLYDMPR